MKLDTARLVLSALATAALLASSATGALAQTPPPDFLLDHYSVYPKNSGDETTGAVVLRDQFGERTDSFFGPEAFWLPVLKRVQPTDDPTLFHPDVHLTLYAIDAPEPERFVTVVNQFGEQGLQLGDAIALLAPARKNPSAGEVPPDEVNHFRCYRALGPSVDVTVQLEDQFRTLETRVLDPSMLCNPAEKELSGGEVFPIVNPDDHLVCYFFPPTLAQNFTLSFLDQFLNGAGTFLGPLQLCVPSKKSGVVPTEESTWGRMKSIYR